MYITLVYFQMSKVKEPLAKAKFTNTVFITFLFSLNIYNILDFSLA
jgi:hypothetical protein